MPWVVKTVQEVVPTFLCLRHLQRRCYRGGAQSLQPTAQPPLINSIMVRPSATRKWSRSPRPQRDFIALIGPEGCHG